MTPGLWEYKIQKLHVINIAPIKLQIFMYVEVRVQWKYELQVFEHYLGLWITSYTGGNLVEKCLQTFGSIFGRVESKLTMSSNQ